MSERICPGCGLAVQQPRMGRRIWHSESCRRVYKRQWENSMRAVCERCGGDMGTGSSRADGSHRTVGALCARCRADVRVERVLRMVELRRAEGLSTRELAERVGVAQPTVSGELQRMRVLGFDVPFGPQWRNVTRGSQATVLDGPGKALGLALAERGHVPPAWEADDAA